MQRFPASIPGGISRRRLLQKLPHHLLRPRHLSTLHPSNPRILAEPRQLPPGKIVDGVLQPLHHLIFTLKLTA